jgi:serine/threonine protein phosphatase PrpC
MRMQELRTAALFCGEAMREPREFSIAQGNAVVFSAVAPNKTTVNEDAAALIPIDDDSAILAVADGVGGSALGDAASRIAIESLREAVPGNLDPRAQLRTAILNGMEAANQAILGLGSGAATTLVVAEVTQDTIRPYHVGDSLMLLIGGRGKLKLQTIPHSPVGYGVEAGLLDEAEAMHHDERHVVSNVVGCVEMRIEIGPTIKLSPRDTLLLATDGLADNLHVGEISDGLRTGRLQRAAQQLAADASYRMLHPSNDHPSKPDDLTFVAFRPCRRRLSEDTSR